jgi:hypothetical protein
VQDRRRPRVARERHPGVASPARAVARSWDRGSKAPPILRRVPADGRHPGLHEPPPFTRRRRRQPRRLPPLSRSARRRAQRKGKSGEATGMSEARSQQHPWEEARPWLASRERRVGAVCRSGLGRRETPGPPVKPRGAQTPRGAHAATSCGSEPGTREVRVNASRTGGRSRSDASSRRGGHEVARPRDRSHDASPKEASSTA